MMEFDPQHGPVERGTAGHHASAQVADLSAEVAALDRMTYRGLGLGGTRTLFAWLRDADSDDEVREARHWLQLRCDKYEGKRWLEWRRRRMEDAPLRCGVREVM